MLNLVELYIILKEKLNTRFDYPTLADEANFERPMGKESRRRREDIEKGKYGWYDKYTPVNTFQDKSYLESVNTDFRKARIRPLYPIHEYTQTDKSKYCHFHRGCDHNIDNYIQLKEEIKELINKRQLLKYVKGGK